MTTTEIASVITCITTVATAVIAVITIRQIKKQRESTYQPVLVAGSSWFNIFNHRFKDDVFFPYEFSKTNHSEEYNPPMPNYQVEVIQIMNIGFGSCKNIFVKIDEKKQCYRVLKVLNAMELYIEEKDRVKITITDHFIRFGSNSKFNGGFHFFHRYRIQYHITHLLPHQNSQSTLDISLPSYINELYACYIYYFNLLFKVPAVKGRVSDFVFPEIPVNISYADLANESYSYTYGVEYQIVSFNGNQSNHAVKIIDKQPI